MDFRLLDSVSNCMDENGVEKLILLEDLNFFEKIGCGLYDIDLRTYITFNPYSYIPYDSPWYRKPTL